MEAELVAAIATDPRAYLVYADWLEGQGQLDRAKVVRAVHALEVERDPARELKLARQILDAAAGLPRAWLATLARTPVAGCFGSGIKRTSTLLVQFQRDGFVGFREGRVGSRTTPYKLDKARDGHWMQIGRAFTFAIGTYSHHDGVVRGASLVGVGSNPEGTWRWHLAPVSDEEFTGGAFNQMPTSDSARRSLTSEAALLPHRAWRTPKPKRAKPKAKSKRTKPAR